jgi:outer membrane protein assembly factor BamB
MPDRFHQMIQFWDAHFKGHHKHVFRTHHLDSNANDQMSAFAILGGAWQLYKDVFANAMGSVFTPRRGQYGWVQDYQVENDAVTSMELLSDDPTLAAHLILFEKPGFGGWHKHVFGTLTDLDGADHAQSAVVFAGSFRLLGSGGGHTDVTAGFNGNIAVSGGSIKSIGVIDWTRPPRAPFPHAIVFDDHLFDGDHRHVIGDIPVLDDGWDGRISSLVIEHGAWEVFIRHQFAEKQGPVLTRGIYPWVGDQEIDNDKIASMRTRTIAPGPAIATVARMNDGHNMTTAHGENYRLGWNNKETQLTPVSIRTPHFGRQWQAPLDDKRTYGQPLVVSVPQATGVAMDVVIAGTAGNNLFALNADTGAVLWQVHMRGGTPDSNGVAGQPLSDHEFSSSLENPCTNTSPFHGINSTPVIDPALNAVFVAYLAKNDTGGNPGPNNDFHQAYFLDAFSLTDGSPFFNAPVLLKADFPRNPGPALPFRPYVHTQRGALTLMRTNRSDFPQVLVPFSSRCDILSKGDRFDWQGWVFSVSAVRQPGQPGAWASSQADVDFDGCGGIWGTAGPSVDDQNRIYAATGNGVWNGKTNFANSIVRLSGNSTPLTVEYYTPRNWDQLRQGDRDLGGSSALILPLQSLGVDPATNREAFANVVVTAGKEGVMYFVNADDLSAAGDIHGTGRGMWQFRLFDGDAFPYSGGISITPAYFDAGAGGRFLYVASPAGSPFHGVVALKLDDLNGETMFGGSVIQFEGGSFHSAPGTPFVTSNGPNDGVVWIVDSHRDGGDGGPESVIKAFDALNGRLLWSSPAYNEQKIGDGRKFVGIVVSQGRLLVPGTGVCCYSLSVPEDHK